MADQQPLSQGDPEPSREPFDWNTFADQALRCFVIVAIVWAIAWASKP